MGLLVFSSPSSTSSLGSGSCSTVRAPAKCPSTHAKMTLKWTLSSLPGALEDALHLWRVLNLYSTGPYSTVQIVVVAQVPL